MKALSDRKQQVLEGGEGPPRGHLQLSRTEQGKERDRGKYWHHRKLNP